MRTITALFVGLGSIGTRHLKNLTNLCADRGWTLQADALRSDLSRPLRDGVAALLHAQYTDLADAPAHYDMVFITNPTSLHADALTRVRGRGGALFIEKPIFSADQTGLDLADCLPAGQKAYVAAPMRWCGVMLALKDRLPGLHPYCARVICSSYLPDWRPGVDYRTVYSAHKAMGGGVTIDLIHEWDYLVELFGVPEQLYNFKGTYSDLEIDSDDLSVYIARYPTLLAEVHLDYFGRGYRRSIELFCHDGSYLADFGAGTLTLPDGTVQHYEEDVNRRYEREMEYFVDYALTGSGESCNPPALALNVLKLTLGGERTMKRLLITICGRAGSKGFKNKNLKNFCGKPLVYYSLSAAELFIKKHPELEIDVALNTDSEDLARLVAAEYPEVIYLPRGAELGGDRVPKVEVYKDSFARMEALAGKQYDAMIDLDITSPLRTEQDIENAFAKAQEREDLQIIFSVCEARRNPWFNMFKIVGDHAEMVIESQFTGRQQAPEVYDVNASIYVIRRAFLVDNPDPILWHSKFGVSVMMDTGIIDIDSEHDYLLMEAIAQHLYAHYPEFNAVRENIRG